MSFDAKFDEFIAALTANTAALNEVIGLTKEGGAATKPETAAAKKKRQEAEAAAAAAGTTGTTTTGNDAGNDAAVDSAALGTFIKDVLATWLGEFGDAKSGHPETEARQEALSKALTQLGVEKASKITKAADLERLKKWHGKALEKDAGFGIGRFAADPKPAEEAGGDIDI